MFVTSDNILTKEDILQYTTEEKIFELVFGYIPEVYKKVTSPFREDRTPGCWFEYSPEGELRFVDFGNPAVIRGTRMKNINCFDAVKIYFKLRSLYDALIYIHTQLDTKTAKKLIKKEKPTIIKRSPVELDFLPRPFDYRDKKFWKKYKISSDNLIEDNVFALESIRMFNTRKGTLQFQIYDIGYAYTQFLNNKMKFYFPKRPKKDRFITNCTQNDMGGMQSLVESGEILFITKSYKDYRVLKNIGLNVVWNQMEGAIPSTDILLSLCYRFKKIYVFFDNDEAGLIGGSVFVQALNNIIPQIAEQIYLPKDYPKDPSDLIAFKGEYHLLKFLEKYV